MTIVIKNYLGLNILLFYNDKKILIINSINKKYHQIAIVKKNDFYYCFDIIKIIILINFSFKNIKKLLVIFFI